MSETIIEQSQENNSGLMDAFFGSVNTYITAKVGESSRERIAPVDYAGGNTDAIAQPDRGETQDGKTIVTDKPSNINWQKVGLYTAIGFGGLVTLGVVYKVVK